MTGDNGGGNKKQVLQMKENYLTELTKGSSLVS
jgi:hypothetical protein